VGFHVHRAYGRLKLSFISPKQVPIHDFSAAKFGFPFFIGKLPKKSGQDGQAGRVAEIWAGTGPGAPSPAAQAGG
jgi:hypothetical protein